MFNRDIEKHNRLSAFFMKNALGETLQGRTGVSACSVGGSPQGASSLHQQ
jgi:hypothetical protein